MPKMRQLFDRIWVLGRRSTVAYLRLYPNPGWMIPVGVDRRLRWSKFYGFQWTRAPKPGNPKGR